MISGFIAREMSQLPTRYLGRVTEPPIAWAVSGLKIPPELNI